MKPAGLFGENQFKSPPFKRFTPKQYVLLKISAAFVNIHLNIRLESTEKNFVTRSGSEQKQKKMSLFPYEIT